MTTATLPRLTTSRPGRFTEIVAALFAGVAEGRAIARRYDQLTRLSTVELAHLGLSRSDIPRAAVDGVAGL